VLDKSQIEAASRTLHDHWRAGTKLAALEPSHRPRDRREAYAIQAVLENHSAGNLFGWKIAATSEAGQKHINVDGPMAGRILPQTVLPDGGIASMAGNEMRVAEPEFAFRMATDLPPRSSPYSVQQILDAVATLHPAIEIPDSRFADFVSAGAAQIIADNACAHMFVLGAPSTANWRSLDLVETGHYAARQAIHRSWQERARRPRIALTWLANELSQLGVTLRTGQIVTTGTCHPPLPIQSSDVFEADFGAIGRLSVRFE
jgi:2-keto-4-pentenoate hydratase